MASYISVNVFLFRYIAYRPNVFSVSLVFLLMSECNIDCTSVPSLSAFIMVFLLMAVGICLLLWLPSCLLIFFTPWWHIFLSLYRKKGICCLSVTSFTPSAIVGLATGTPPIGLFALWFAWASLFNFFVEQPSDASLGHFDYSPAWVVWVRKSRAFFCVPVRPCHLLNNTCTVLGLQPSYCKKLRPYVFVRVNLEQSCFPACTELRTFSWNFPEGLYARTQMSWVICSGGSGWSVSILIAGFSSYAETFTLLEKFIVLC